MELSSLYREVFSNHTLPVSGEIIERLVAYHRELVRWNRGVSLTALKTDEEIAVKLFYDSSVAAGLLSEGQEVLDVGSGAGFPGAVLAIMRPDVRVTLAESRSKKVAFLKRIRYLLGLRNVNVWERRVEPEGGRGQFDVVTEKATAPPSEFLRLAQWYLKPGGRAILYSGSRGLVPASFELEREMEYVLPMGFGRRVLAVYVMGAA